MPVESAISQVLGLTSRIAPATMRSIEATEYPVEASAIELYRKLRNTAIDGIWRGGLTKVYDSLGVSRTHYSRIMGLLVESGAIEKLEKGSGFRGSTLKVHEEPTLERLVALSPVISESKSRTRDQLTMRVDSIERRVGTLDIPFVIANQEKRIARLENEINDLKKRLDAQQSGGQ